MSGNTKIVHWSGGARWKDARGWSNTASFGFPCCCSGPRAQEIACAGRQTARDKELVNCKQCLRIMRAAEIIPDEPAITRREDIRLLESLAANLLTTDSRLSEAVTRAIKALGRA